MCDNDNIIIGYMLINTKMFLLVYNHISVL